MADVPFQENKWYHTYDAITICISVFDFLTDIIILIEYKLGGAEYEAFFILSIISLVLANMCYVIAFWVVHIPFNNSSLKNSMLFVVSLLCCCFIPFIMLFGAKKDSKTRKFLQKLGFQFGSIDTSAQRAVNQTDLKKFVKYILRQHVGFIIEAIVESLPQS